MVCQLMLNLCTLVQVLISTPPGFWYLHMLLYAMSHLHFPCYHTFPDIGHCLHATLTCTDTCTAVTCTLHCTALPPIFCVSMATPDTLPFSHVISMPVATGYTCTDLMALELGEEKPASVGAEVEGIDHGLHPLH